MVAVGTLLTEVGTQIQFEFHLKQLYMTSFFLVNKEGEEASFQLQDFNVAIRKDNIVTVFWAYTENKRNTSQYIGVMNNTTKEKTLDNKIISTIAFWGSETQSATGCMIYILLFLAIMLVLGLLFFHPVVALLLGTGLIVGWIMYTNKIKETAKTFISQVKFQQQNYVNFL